MIDAGRELTFTVTGTVHEGYFSVGAFGTTQEELRREVAVALSRLVEVLELRVESNDSWIMANTWTYYAVITVRTKFAHAGGVDDIRKIVDGAFWTAAGTDPVTTGGEDSQNRPRVESPSSGIGAAITGVAVIVVGAIVLLIWARP